MIDIKEINKEIKKLENSSRTTMNVCQQLAILYIVRDHLKMEFMNETTKDGNSIKSEPTIIS